jgi:hypothetical protein
MRQATVRRLWPLAALALAMSLLAGEVRAASSLIDNWYAALVATDEDSLAAMLDPEVKIRLLDLNVVQTKAEYVASLAAWEKAAIGLTLRHRIVATDSNITTMLACYDFASNEVLMSETFKIDNNLITENVQRVVAESCDGF